MATHSSVLAWRVPGTVEPGGLPSMGSHRVGHDWNDLAVAAWRPRRPPRTNTHTHTYKRCSIHHWGLECKRRKSEIPGVTGKFGLGEQNKAGKRLTEFCQENALVIANTLFQQHKRRLYSWTSPDGQHQNQIDYILCSQRWRSSIQSAKIRLGADYGSYHESLLPNSDLNWRK